MNRKTWAIASAALLVVGSIGLVRAEEEKSDKIDLDKAPAAVQETVKKAVGSDKLEELKKETEDGKTVFEAEIEGKTGDRSIKVSEAGAILEEESEIEVKDLPAAVTAAVKAKYADGKIEGAEMSKADGKVNYELEVEVGDKDHDLVVAADGTISKDEIAKEEKKDGDKKEEAKHEEKK